MSSSTRSSHRYGAKPTVFNSGHSNRVRDTRRVIAQQPPGASFTNVNVSAQGETRARPKSGGDGPINPNVRSV